MPKPKSGFLDIHLEREWTIRRTSKGETKTVKVKRSKTMQLLLEKLIKDVGEPCKAFIPHCLVCEAWLAFVRIDEIFID